jgi:hypothetical protein
MTYLNFWLVSQNPEEMQDTSVVPKNDIVSFFTLPTRFSKFALHPNSSQ